jgi:glycosyltransferase involved in cell wall biosynthesis
MILNLDDPLYTTSELEQLRLWELGVEAYGFRSSIVCTTSFTREYFLAQGLNSSVHVISQGHSNAQSFHQYRDRSGEILNLVYISPSIDVKGDKHEGHNMWDASLLLNEIWPRVKASNARLHLVGRLGENAKKVLSDSRVVSHGLMSVENCARLIPRFDLALYPRRVDNGWMPQKLAEYIGAGLPLLGLMLSDTAVVDEFKVGVLVESASDFARTIDVFSLNPELLTPMREAARLKSVDLNWASLASKYESLYD